MNEDKLMELLNRIDDDLIEQEIDKLLEGVEIDMESIKKKGYKKLENNKVKRKRIPYIIAACICVLSMTIVYAEDISQAIKAFMNKTSVYSTIVDGEAYYLKEGYDLNKDIRIENVMVSEGNLEIEITTGFSKDELGEINIIPKNNPNIIYYPGGYSEEENKYNFTFMNKAEENYNIKPFKDFNIIIGGNSYNVSLEKAKSLDLDKKIYTSNVIKNNLQGVDIGAKLIDNNGKLNIQLIAGFEDKDLKLVKFGKPFKQKVFYEVEDKGKDGIFSSGTSNRTEDLYVLDEMKNQYKLEIPKNAKGRPVTTFETNAPKDKSLTLKLPAIIASYEKTIDSFSLDIPNEGEVALNKEIDFNIQKAIIKKIKRMSETSAQVELELNTHGDENIKIRSFDIYSPDIKKISTEFNGNKGIMNLEFDKNMNKTNVKISYPDFIMNGNWVIDMK